MIEEEEEIVQEEVINEEKIIELDNVYNNLNILLKFNKLI